MAVLQPKTKPTPSARPRPIPEPPRRNDDVHPNASDDEGRRKKVGRRSEKEFLDLWNRLIEDTGLTRLE